VAQSDVNSRSLWRSDIHTEAITTTIRNGAVRSPLWNSIKFRSKLQVQRATLTNCGAGKQVLCHVTFSEDSIPPLRATSFHTSAGGARRMKQYPRRLAISSLHCVLLMLSVNFDSVETLWQFLVVPIVDDLVLSGQKKC